MTSLDTLTSQDTMFKAMFSGRMEVVQDNEGLIEIKMYLFLKITIVFMLF